MKYIRQFFIILIISFVGEILNYILPLPVPASIYGLVILFVCLQTGLIKLSQIKETAGFFLEIMPLMFIPAAVGLLPSWNVIRPALLPYLVITVVSTVCVMLVSGHVTQGLMRFKKGRHTND